MASHRLDHREHLCTRQHCHQPTQNYLCENCTTQLANMLSELPWLLDELDARIQKLDRINLGTIGRNRRPDELNVIDFDAAETARKVRKALHDWVEQIALHHTGRTPPGLSTVTTKELARWLYVNVEAIALTPIAGAIYHDINKLAGTDTERRGQLITAINPRERHFAGPCPTIRGHNPDGETIECGTTLYADVDETTIICPTCRQKIDVERNRRKAASDRDLHTKDEILEILTDIGEKVVTSTLDQWIRARRLRRVAWLHEGQIVNFRIRRSDPALYSLARARKLRHRDNRLTQRPNTLAEQQ